ncbi:MAG: ArsS family sensor histidine kinase [Campylobacteraceae bacterium]|jgi:two-component system OmpR family sensor kinase|nr:ArsS family sensor histidine kinase [Campylobacteraceae bacterium]
MRRFFLGTKANIAFALSFLFLFVLFWGLHIYSDELNRREFQSEHERYIYLLTLHQTDAQIEGIEGYFEGLDLHKVDNGALKEKILKQGVVLSEQNNSLGNFLIITYGGKQYPGFRDKDNITLFESRKENLTDTLYLVIFLGLCAFLAWLYLFTAKSIRPIKELSVAIKKFASGDMSAEAINDKDSRTLKEFNNAIKDIANLHSSRTLFMRTIMHELKTPIGKGRIIAAMVEDDLNRERLIKVFRRLEALVNEFGKTEQLITKNYQIEKKRCSLKDILNLSFNILMLEPEQLEKRVIKKIPKKDIYIDADADSMSLAFKNLIDNAIKYSSDGRVSVTLEQNTLTFCNKGKPLDKPLSDYRQAFVTSDTDDKASMKMGLGLYIVDNILTLHGLKLNYEYKDGYHCFFINLIAS